MTNLHHKQEGLSTIILSVAILIAVTLISLAAAEFIVTKYRHVNNEFRTQQAFHTAQAGLDYTVTYMNDNYATLTDGQQVTGATPNSGAYSVTINFIGGSKDTINLVSVGNSTDGSASRTISQKVKYISGALTTPDVPVTTAGSLDMDSNSRIRNDYGQQTTLLGGSADLSSNARTYNEDGTSSTSVNVQSDITQGDAALAALSEQAFQAQFLGTSISDLASSATVNYTYNNDHNYSNQLNGVEGVTISIIQTGGDASISSNTQIGSSANPVTIILQGDIEISSNVDIYGNVIATGKITFSSNVEVHGLVFSSSSDGIEFNSNSEVHGAVIARGLIELNSNARINYEPSILNSTLNIQGGGGGYGKIPGSWKDFI